MTTDTLMTIDEFNEQILAAIREGGPEAREKCLAIAQEAIKNPHLLDRYKEHWDKLEYHTQRGEDCAVKAFNFDGTMPNFGTVHDHAGFWAVYIVAKGQIETKFYEEIEPGKEPWPGLRELKHLVLKEGESMVLDPHELHSVFSDVPGSVALTIYNGDLNGNVRRIYDIKNKIFIRDRSQWEARRKAGAYGVAEGGMLRKLDTEEVLDEA